MLSFSWQSGLIRRSSKHYLVEFRWLWRYQIDSNVVEKRVDLVTFACLGLIGSGMHSHSSRIPWILTNELCLCLMLEIGLAKCTQSFRETLHLGEYRPSCSSSLFRHSYVYLMTSTCISYAHLNSFLQTCMDTRPFCVTLQNGTWFWQPNISFYRYWHCKLFFVVTCSSTWRT